MDLWQRLITYRKKNDSIKPQKTSAERNESPNSCTGEGAPFQLQKDGIRVLLFRECDTRGRKLLYDSKTVVRVPIAETASTVLPSCKTMFKSSKYISASSSTAGLSSSSVSHLSAKKSSSSNVKSSSSSSCPKSETFAEINGRYGYQYQQPEGDTKQLGELVFGTVALAYRGSCSKLHILQKPQRILLSRTSPAPRSYMRPSCTGSDQGIEDSSFSSSLSSLGEVVISRTESLDMPYGHGGPSWAVDMPHILSTSHSEGDSGFGGPPSPYGSTCGSFLSPPSLPNTPFGTPSSRQGSGSSLKNSGSLNSLQRRFLRNVTTSLEALGREGDIAEDSVISSGHHSHRVTRLGVAVIIEVGSDHSEMDRQVEDWLFLHLSVLEASLNKLQSSLDSAYLHPKTFASTTHEAVTQLQQDMLDLVRGPRLCRPVWLGLLGKSSPSDRQTLCANFVDVLASVLATVDTKQTNFFVSKLLTAVLTHHLGWVSTVAPGDCLPQLPSSASSSRSGSDSAPSSPSQPEDGSMYHTTWVERLNESHPYSAVWAQLCELSGAVGYPPRAARTVLVGSNSSLLAQLLTILSYIIRCSQISEQDIQSCPMGDNPSPERQQPCFSRTSSVASVITIVEGSQHQNQTRRNSSAKLHRDSSIRRSWRMSKENRGSRIFPHEKRVGSGDNTAESVMGTLTGPSKSDEYEGSMADRGQTGQLTHSSSNPLPSKKEKEGAAKWMLNDDVAIVIEGEKIREGEGSTNNLAKKASEPEKSLTTSKTSTNLSQLIDYGSDSSPVQSVSKDFHKPFSKAFHEPSSVRLYPSLLDLDDHRETFGTVTLEPDIIAEKVQKLFRTPSKCNISQEPQSFDIKLSQSSSAKTCSQSSWRDAKLKTSLGSFNIPHDSAQASGIGFLSGDTVLTGPAQNDLVADCAASQSISAQKTLVNSQCIQLDRKSPSRVIPAKDIEPEIEEGGKVLFLIGEDERIEGLKKISSKLDDAQPSVNNSEPSWVSLGPNNIPAIGFERFDNLAKAEKNKEYPERSATPPVKPLQSHITSLPMPVDVRKVVRLRNVGRESARDLTILGRENVIYPSLSELKLTPKVNIDKVRKNQEHSFSKTHRRIRSDPTNGDYIHGMPLPCSEPLNGVLEEHTADSKVLSDRKDCKSSDCSAVNAVTNCDFVNKYKIDSELDAGIVLPSALSRDSDPPSEVEDGSILKDSNRTKDAKPEVIQMPRFECVNPQRSFGTNGASVPSSSLAASLLGGVLDHYSSVFVLHATTQTNHWEDALRQDLSAAAHHSTLDQQVAEAVAVVADTDSWEVQVVSSHSFIVERSGSGSQVGVRVEMSPLVSAITDSVLDLTRLSVDPQFIMQHLEERLCELYLKSQLLAEYLLHGAACGFGGSEASFSRYHLPELTRTLGLNINDLPLLLAVASTHTPAVTRMFGISIK